ncbi:MAG: hypothetical protein JNK40_04600 [Chromatiales bacterium]|nr:hypothetical protein [Chromatiales bacterium]
MRRICLALAIAVVVAGAGSAIAADDQAAGCLRLDNRIAELRLKLRLGYSARQGRVYRQKLAALEAERRQLCRR